MDGLKQITEFCNRCRCKTRHEEIYPAHEYNVHDERLDRPIIVTWVFHKCCGCGEVHALQTLQCLDLSQPETHYYPLREIRCLPKWSAKLPDHGRTLLHEVYLAIHSGSLCLATMGARALMDLAFQAAVGDCGTFKNTLDAMIKEGFLAPQNRDVLEAALDTGHAASHRGHKPDTRQFEAVMDVVEHLLEEVFYLRGLERDLQQAVPARQARRTGGSDPNGV